MIGDAEYATGYILRSGEAAGYIEGADRTATVNKQAAPVLVKQSAVYRESRGRGWNGTVRLKWSADRQGRQE